MNWKLVVLEVVSIVAIVVLACCCPFGDIVYCLICFFMIFICVAPFVCWVYEERINYLNDRKKQTGNMQQILKDTIAERDSDIVKKIDDMKMRIECLEEKFKNKQ